jgi:phosphopantetheinyl transferase (holo-ACP synthase)
MLAKTAKAFPSQIRVGVDVTQLSRFLSIIGKHEKQKNGVTLEGWARRVLNPLERPQWHTKLAQYRECRTDDNARMKLASFMAGR